MIGPLLKSMHDFFEALNRSLVVFDGPEVTLSDGEDQSERLEARLVPYVGIDCEEYVERAAGSYHEFAIFDAEPPDVFDMKGLEPVREESTGLGIDALSCSTLMQRYFCPPRLPTSWPSVPTLR